MPRRNGQPTLHEVCERRTHDALKASLEAPFDAIVADALSPSYTEAAAAINALAILAARGRREAVVALRGLLCELDAEAWRLRSVLVLALGTVKTRGVADQLVAELRRTKPMKRLHEYLGDVVEALCGFPGELVRDAIAGLEWDGVVERLPVACSEKLRGVARGTRGPFHLPPTENSKAARDPRP